MVYIIRTHTSFQAIDRSRSHCAKFENLQHHRGSSGNSYIAHPSEERDVALLTCYCRLPNLVTRDDASSSVEEPLAISTRISQPPARKPASLVYPAITVPKDPDSRQNRIQLNAMVC